MNRDLTDLIVALADYRWTLVAASLAGYHGHDEDGRPDDYHAQLAMKNVRYCLDALHSAVTRRDVTREAYRTLCANARRHIHQHPYFLDALAAAPPNWFA